MNGDNVYFNGAIKKKACKQNRNCYSLQYLLS